MITLVSSDNELITVEEDIVRCSVLIKPMAESPFRGDQSIPLPCVSARVLRKVLEYCEHHRGKPLPAADGDPRSMYIDEWDQEFLDHVDADMLFDIIMAANYLDINPLLHVGSRKVANMIKGKTPEEIRMIFGVKENDG